MKKTYILNLVRVLAALVLLGTGPSHAAEVPDVTNRAVVEAFVDGVVKPSMKQYHNPSGVVTLMKGGEIIFTKGYGYIDVEKRIPVNPETSLFRPGSISKLFTWVSVMQLVEQGKLDLDVDVNQYLNTFQIEDSWPGQPVTLRHIMTHTGGFEDNYLGILILDDVSRIMPLATSVAKYQPERVSAPGEQVAYSNWATALAGLIVSNISGVSFNDYIQQNIFDVLGMKNASFMEPLPLELDVNMAKAYSYEAGKYKEQNYEIISNFGPAGASAISAYDMTLFARALLGGGAYDGKRILKTETLQQMRDEGYKPDARIRAMGLGFMDGPFGPDGFDNFGHNGGTTIFSSHFGLSVKEDLMLFSSFSGGPGGGATLGAFVQSFYDEFFPREVPVITPPADFAERSARYAGTYNNWRSSFTKIESLLRAFGGIKVVPLPDNTMMIGPKRYVEVDKNLFREVDHYGQVVFLENENGQITSFVFDGRGGTQLNKAPFYETASFLILFLGLSFLVFIGVVLRLAYQWTRFKALQGGERKVYLASVILATFSLLFFVLAGLGVSGGMLTLVNELPAVLKLSLIFPMLATIAGFYHAYCSVLVWRQGLCGSAWGCLRYSVISFCGVFMVWFYYYWNLLGFNYFN